MKTTNLSISAAILFLFAVSFIGCKEKDKYDVLIPETVTGTLDVKTSSNQLGNSVTINFRDSVSGNNIKVESSVENSVLKSVLSLKEGSNWVEVNRFEIDVTNDDYRRKMNSMVEAKAKIVKSNFDISELSRMSNILDEIPQMLFDKLGRKDFHQAASQAMFYHMGVVNSARRALSSKKEDCDCGINVSYLKDKTPFLCLEDKLMEAEEALRVIMMMTNGPKFSGKQFNPEKTLNYLKTNLGKTLVASKIQAIIYAEMDDFYDKLSESDIASVIAMNKKAKMQNPRVSGDGGAEGEDVCEIGEIEGRAPFYCAIIGVTQGNQCGCCGNYSGACLCCNPLCVMHDFKCATDCTPWYCGPDCQLGCP